MADVVAWLDRASPLGYCLRQSLTRYRVLRRIDLPLVVHFGARFVDGKPDREISGHAWLTLNGEPYHELTENWRGFTVMWSYPETSQKPLLDSTKI